MSLTNAFFIFFLLACGLALVVWIFWRNWSPEQLPLWAGLIWGLMAAMMLAPRFLPASIRWSENLSVVQGIAGVAVVALSIKCLILLIRYGSTLAPPSRTAAWLGLAPLFFAALAFLVLLWSTGFFSGKK